VDELLDLAIEVIAEKGLEGCTFKALAERAGTSTTTFTYWFGTRTNLLAEVLERTYTRSLEASGTEDLDPVRRLYAFGLADLQAGDQAIGYSRAYIEILIAAPRHPEWLAALHRADAPYQRILETVFEQAQETGRIDPDLDADTFSLALWSLVNGLNITRSAYPDEFGPAEVEAQYRRMFEGIIGRPVEF